LNAKKDLLELFYAGEERPHVRWDEFEIRFTNAFATLDKDAEI